MQRQEGGNILVRGEYAADPSSTYHIPLTIPSLAWTTTSVCPDSRATAPWARDTDGGRPLLSCPSE